MLTERILCGILVKHFTLHRYFYPYKDVFYVFEKDLNIGYLLDFYGVLLSDRKRSVMDMYYNEDFSLSEIAEQIGISRQGVRDIIKKSEDELLFYEEKLGLAQKLQSVDEKAAKLYELSHEKQLPEDIRKEIAELTSLIRQ